MDSSIESKQKRLAKHYEEMSKHEFDSYNTAVECEIEGVIPYCYANYYFYSVISKYLNGECLDFTEMISLEAVLEIRKMKDYGSRSEYMNKEFGGILTQEEIDNVLSFETYGLDVDVLNYIDAVKNQEASNLRRHIGLLKFRKVLKKY